MSEREETTGWRADLNGLCDRADYGETPDGMKRDEVEPAHARIQAHVEALEGALREIIDTPPFGTPQSIARAALAGESETCTHRDESGNLVTHPIGESDPPTTCPTCGSDDPRRRLSIEGKVPGVRPACTNDPWHTVPTGTDTIGDQLRRAFPNITDREVAACEKYLSTVPTGTTCDTCGSTDLARCTLLGHRTGAIHA